MGMAHRGRLNVLANIFGKTLKIFSELTEKDYDEDANFDGDVKYHLGLTSDRLTNSGKNQLKFSSKSFALRNSRCRY